MDLVSTMIRSDITLFDDAIESRDSAEADEANFIDADDGEVVANAIQPRITHSSIQRDITFADLESFYSEDVAFRNFRHKLSAYLATRLGVQRTEVMLRLDDIVSLNLLVSPTQFTS